MRQILLFCLPIWLLGASCEEAIELSIEEFIKPGRNATATALAGERAAQICLAEHGEEHENTIMALNNSGSFFMLSAEPQKALAKSYHGVASAQAALGRYEEAAASFRAAIRCYALDAYKARKELMSCYAGLGDTLYKAGDFNGALANHGIALKIFEEVFGADAINSLRAKYYELLASDLAALGKSKEALKNYEKALEILGEILEKSADDEYAKALKNEIEAKGL